MSKTRPGSKRNRRIKIALMVLGVIAVSLAVAAAIVFGGGLPLLPFAPVLVAAAVNPFAVMGVLAAGVIAGLTLLGGLVYGLSTTIRKWRQTKVEKPVLPSKESTDSMVLSPPLNPWSLATSLAILKDYEINQYRHDLVAQQNSLSDFRSPTYPIYWRPWTFYKEQPRYFTYAALLPSDYDRANLQQWYWSASGLLILLREECPLHWQKINDELWQENVQSRLIALPTYSPNPNSMFSSATNNYPAPSAPPLEEEYQTPSHGR